MPKYISSPAYPDRMPVDISFVFAHEKPAGKRGFLEANEDWFRFGDGTTARFWGVNFNGGANFPEHGYAEMVACRLAQSGCNLVRFHQLDAEWNTPNIYAFTKGERVKTTRELDPTSLERMDYLVHCLKEQGIYVYLDMMTYRKFKSGDGVPHAEELGDSAKPYSIFDRRLIDLQKEFCSQIWNHINPYTGLAYKNDPVFVMTEITNECDLFTKLPPEKTPHSPYYERKYHEALRDWLDKSGKTHDWENCDLYAPEQIILDFKMDLTLSYYREMYEHMRGIGVKIPITGTNWTNGAPGNTTAQREMDFVDCHHYYYDWRWGETEKICMNAQINGNAQSILADPGHMRVNGRPYFISEWDMPWPNIYRAEGPIYYAAVCALQDWSGMAIHTYAYASQKNQYELLGKESSSSSIGGIPYREGIFTVWNDPAKFGLFYHCALIVRRGDISPAGKKIGVVIADMHRMATDAYASGMERHRLATVLEGGEAVGCAEIVSSCDTITDAKGNSDLIVSDNGQVWRIISKKIGGIDTERTKVLYGKLSSGCDAEYGGIPESRVDGFIVECKTDFGVVALSSLTDDSINISDNMLLTAIGRACNSGAVFDGDKMLEFGTLPIISEAIQARIRIRTGRRDHKVWGINAEGFYVGAKSVSYEDGYMVFDIGDRYPSNYYLIVAE